MINVLVVAGETSSVALSPSCIGSDAERVITTDTTVGGALERLNDDDPVDCIVSEYDLETVDGVTFLEFVRSQEPTLPFVLLGGDDDAARRAIGADVTEHLRGDRLDDDRLETAVDAAVAYDRSKPARDDTQSHVRSVLDAAHDPVAIVRDGRYEYLNEAGFELLGLASPAEPATLEETCLDGVTGFELASLDPQHGADRVARYSSVLRGENEEPIPVELAVTSLEWDGKQAFAVVIRNRHPRLQELKQSVIDAAPVGVTVADARCPGTPLIFANEEFERLTGYPASEALGRNCRFLQGPETESEPVSKMRAAIDAGESVSVELRNYRKDGTMFWNRVSLAPLESADGEVTHYVGFQQDISDRKERERKHHRIKEAAEHAGHAIIITDTNGRITYVNPAFERITGYTESEALGTNPRILKSGEHDRRFYERLWETILNGEVWQAEIVNQRKDGERIVVDQTIAPIFSDDGSIDRFVGIYRDITERKEREQELKLFQNAFEQAGHAVMITDRDGTIEYVNEAFEEKTGYARTEAIGATPKILKSGKQDEGFYEEMWEAILSGKHWSAEIVNQRKSGELYAVDQTIGPVTNEDGEITHFIAIESDITPKQLRKQWISVLNRILRHNIRNTVTIIEGHARQLAEELDDPDHRESAAAILERSESLARISEKAMSMNELIQREYESIPTIDVPALLEELMPALRDRFPHAEINIDGVDRPALARVDAEMLRVALEEAVENAVVHHDGLAPSIAVDVTSPSTPDDQLEITVADDGPGIPEHERTAIEAGTETPLFHGSAIGLWTIRWVATSFGGSIVIDENEPRGTVVTITLPVADDDDKISNPADGR